jgi:hypothetical protein
MSFLAFFREYWGYLRLPPQEPPYLAGSLAAAQESGLPDEMLVRQRLAAQQIEPAD